MADGDVKSPQRKRARTIGGREDRYRDGRADEKERERKKADEDEDNKPPGKMGKVTANEILGVHAVQTGMCSGSRNTY